jgi:hypothetical protein
VVAAGTRIVASVAALTILAGCGTHGSGAASSAPETHSSPPQTVPGTSTGGSVSSPGPTSPTSTLPASSRTCRGVAPCADFATPSGNIKCFASALQGGGIECDILSGLKPLPTTPCELDRPGLYVGAAGNAVSACRSDPTLVWFDKHVPVLAYGATWAGFGTTCLSQASGLTCVNAKGRGFFLSRERWSIF